MFNREQLRTLAADGISPVVYLVCLRAVLLAVFITLSDGENDFFEVFGDETVIHGAGWSAMAISAALLTVAGTILKRGAIVAYMTMTLFVLWLYLVVLYLYTGQTAYALVEATTMLLFAYIYVDVSVNRAWGWVPGYARHNLTEPAASDRL